MSDRKHYRALEEMYQASPINAFYQPIMTVGKGEATIEIALSEKFHHSAGAVHGSVYFKLLDDAAFFAANSLEKNCFVLTTSFTTYLTSPVVSGKLIAVGNIVNQTRSQFVAEAVVYDEDDHEVGRGSGIFSASKLPLESALGYSLT